MRERSPHWETVAAVLAVATFGLLEVATTLESWNIIALALVIPLVFSLIYMLAADPRSD
jgi:hypothetical protein